MAVYGSTPGKETSILRKILARNVLKGTVPAPILKRIGSAFPSVRLRRTEELTSEYERESFPTLRHPVPKAFGSVGFFTLKDLQVHCFCDMK